MISKKKSKSKSKIKLNKKKSRNPKNTHFEIETELQSKVYKYMSRHYNEYSNVKDLVKATGAHFKIKNIGTPNSSKVHWIWEIPFLIEGLM